VSFDAQLRTSLTALATALADALQLDGTRAATLANDMETLVRAARAT
jgi:hypothetical protein